MGNFILRSLMFILLPSLALGQSLNISPTSGTASNNPSTFTLQEGKISISSSDLQFLKTDASVGEFESYSISPDRSVISVLQKYKNGAELVLFNPAGDTLNQYETINLSSNDPSQSVYSFNSGMTLLRNNITQFTFYDASGEIFTSMSSSSQSEEGEMISEVARSSEGGTIVIYNPKIKRSGEIGSKAEVMGGGGSFETVFSSSDRFIKEVQISDGGGVLGIVTAANGRDDRVLIIDKYGNELNSIEAGETLRGMTFSEDADYVTLYSTGRVMVYSTLTGQRVGSTSLRNSVFQSRYFPEDNLILVLSGSYSEGTGILNNVEFRAIDVQQRQIASEEYGSALGFNQALEPKLTRSSAGRYDLTGASRQLRISAQF